MREQGLSERVTRGIITATAQRGADPSHASESPRR